MSQSLSDHFFGVGQTVFVQTADIADSAITSAKLAALTIATGDLADLSVTSGKLAADSVIAGKIAAGAISAAGDFAAGVVDGTALASGAVTAGKIGAGGISAANQFAAGVVDSAALAANTVTSADVALNLLQYAVAPLTAQNILNMYGAPVTLIAAPGANMAIVVHDIMFEMKRSATAFANGGAVSIEYATGDDVVATIASTVITGAAGTTLSTRVMANLSDIALASIENDALNITNATAAFITGTGTADVHIWYSVIDVTA